tara:strand:+ start:239 stop:418 length:180 start_codon:yes stop_codon:yes gene_type:complete
MKFLRRLWMCLFLLLAVPAVHGFTMTFSESQLNTMVTAVFPQQRTFDDLVFTFSDPLVV